MNKKYVITIATVVALGGFLFGFDAAVISGVISFIRPEFELTEIQIGWVVSSLTLTSTVAMAFAGPLSDKYGRKTVLIFYRYSLCCFCDRFGIGTDLRVSGHRSNDWRFCSRCGFDNRTFVHCRNLPCRKPRSNGIYQSAQHCLGVFSGLFC